MVQQAAMFPMVYMVNPKKKCTMGLYSQPKNCYLSRVELQWSPWT